MSQAKQVFCSNRVFKRSCRKARPAKWLKVSRVILCAVLLYAEICVCVQ